MKLKNVLYVLITSLSAFAQTNAPAIATNSVTSISIILKAAKQNDAEAQYKLGDCYRKGEGVAKNGVEAVKWYRRAAEQDYAPAQNSLGVSYYNGEGVTQDAMEAVKWYRKAVKQNYAKAQNDLGLCYAHGQGVAKDAVEAVNWFRKAAEQNCAPAQSNLGVCYDDGQGVAKDAVEAVKWYRKAADQNNDEAQCNLGSCYENGNGVLKDYVEAYKWYNLAATQGNVRAINRRGIVASKMTPEEIAKVLPTPIKYTAKQIAQAKQIAIVQLNRYFKIERDQVEERTTIESKEPAITKKGTQIKVVCFVGKDDPIPDEIHFKITGRSYDWQYLDYSRFVIKYDDQRKTFEKLEDKGTVLHNGTVLEQMFADLSFDEFREITMADSVQVKLGIEEFQFDDDYRAEWRALFQYFDVIKAEKTLNAVPIDPKAAANNQIQTP